MGRRKPPSPELQLSREVAWYLESRGIPWPKTPPRFKTPEAGQVLTAARFDPERVDRVITALGSLTHTQGEWAGRPLRPDPWQVAYILAPVYGWVHRARVAGAWSWVRVVRTQYVELGKKNGKTTLAGGQALYLCGGDGEAGAQVVAVALGRDQAGYCFAPVKALAESSPGLQTHFRTVVNRVIHRRTGSYFMVVSSLADLLQGANLSGAVIEELHVHRTRDLVDAVESATGARAQPLVIIVTTADDGSDGTIYAEKRRYVEQLAGRVFVDPTFYGVIWAAADTADPFVETTWKAANPGYGISPTRTFMQTEARRAKTSPAALARFRRFHLCIRDKAEGRFITLESWDANAGLVDEAALAGRRCYGGLDLASTTDLCALAWVFPDDTGGYDALWRLWAPEAALGALAARTAGAARVWVTAGLLTLTPGNVTDYDHIRAQVNADREGFDVAEIAYDPWNSSQLVSDLISDEAVMVPERQGYATLSSPTKQLARLVAEGTPARPRFRHGGNPAVRWMVDNLTVDTDPAGNVKPSRRSSRDKIDGVVAAIMGLDRATRHTGPAPRSVYEERGLTVG